MRRALLFTALLLAIPSRAAAQEPDDRPFGRGVIMPSVALGGSFARSYGGSLLVGAGASYFVANGFAVGLHLRNVTTFYSRSFKDAYPGLVEKIPTNEFSILPSLQWVFYRSRYFSPYVYGGVGPVFLNHQRGVVGQWSAGPGFLIGTGGPLYIDIGILFSMRFPNGRCQDAYSVVDGDTLYTNSYACSFTWGFRGGIVFGLGGRRERRAPAPQPPPQPVQSTPQSYPAPTSYPPPTAAPPPVPSDSPTTAPQPAPAPAPVAPPLENPPTSAPPPATTTSPPAGENVPVPPPV